MEYYYNNYVLEGDEAEAGDNLPDEQPKQRSPQVAGT
jgi:hypothetical protein